MVNRDKFFTFLSCVSTLEFCIQAKQLGCHRAEISEAALLLLLTDCLGLDEFLILVLTHALQLSLQGYMV